MTAPGLREFPTGATRDTEAGKLDHEGFLSPTVMERLEAHSLREREVAWAAGIFEGEGCIYLGRAKYPRLQIRMTDEDVLIRFCSIVGRGKVLGPKTYKDRPHYKPYYDWATTRVDDALATMALLLPYLGNRRRQKAEEVFGLRAVAIASGVPAEVIDAFGRYMHRHRQLPDGSMRPSDNWKLGIPIAAYMSSLMRHVQEVWLHHSGRGELARESLLDALMACMFNVQGIAHETLKERRKTPPATEAL